MPQEFAQTLPPSRKRTPPRLPKSGARSSDVNENMLSPPTGSPDSLSGLTSYRPQPRIEVAPPRKYFFENGTSAWLPFGGSMLPIWARFAQTSDRPIGR